MGAGAFSNDSVVTELNDIICIKIDTQSESGGRVALEYGVRHVPSLLFLNPDSSPRDSIDGNLATQEILAEVTRIKSDDGTINDLRATIAKDSNNLDAHFPLISKLKDFNARDDVELVCKNIKVLVEQGRGYDASDVDSVYQLYLNLHSINMPELAAEQVTVMHSLDPAGKSLGLRTLAFKRLKHEVREPQDLPELLTFLESEVHANLLFKGWYTVYNVYNAAAKRTRQRELNKHLRQAARNAAVSLWQYTPPEYTSKLGNSIAWDFYEDAKQLTEAEKEFAVRVAKAAMLASKESVIVMDTYACCLFMSGRVEEAVEYIDKCIELDPGQEQWTRRRAMFLSAD